MKIRKFNTEPKLNAFERYETHFTITYTRTVNGFMKYVRLGEFDCEDACLKAYDEIIAACKKAGMTVTEVDEYTSEVKGTGSKIIRDKNPKSSFSSVDIEVDGTITCSGFDCIVNRPVKKVLNNNLGITIKY